MSAGGYIAGPAVLLDGRAAYLLARLLPRELIEARLDRAGIRESLRGEILEPLAAIRRAGAAYERAAAERLEVNVRSSGHSPRPEAADHRSSSAMARTLSTTEAALQLGCTDRHVRRLLDEGRLIGHLEGRCRRVDEGSVILLADQRARRAA